MPVNPPGLMLRVIWLVHFVLTSWAILSPWMSSTYLYTHVVVLAFGFWALVSSDNVEAVFMFLLTLVFSVLNDIICISLYAPRGRAIFSLDSDRLHEYRFSLGMAITNLIIKPVTIFFTYRIYQSRAQGTDFNTGIPGLGSGQTVHGHYDNIDNTPPPGGYDKSAPPAYQAPGDEPTYQAPHYNVPPPLGQP
ncbi:type-1 angiotensin II receptor-associated protein-like [Physella acuta]|uniref:type-1 angiotensin II receptor-associated protein-like n=1 Tax=Physella acuta TaxID=109671 RepID=UPI0027DB3E28|nr:type-1 angiotensin II receptor-associated protein-like [Physella acuta]XP_059143334.1 type-1 angiotensin II receptor-associated protein-like [Physella acuta]XP_059143335.1 type-1 angiotensin II receptor-associated protein-like [Physella acuta]